MFRKLVLFAVSLVVAEALGIAAPQAQTPSLPRLISIALSGGAGFASLRLTTADFNEDRYPDIVVSRAYECRVALILSDGSGSFREPTFLSLGECLFPQAMATADFNRDGHEDLALADGDAIVLPGDGAGGFGRPLRSPVNLGAVELNMAAMDLNNDGYTDLVAPNWYCCPVIDYVTMLTSIFSSPMRTT